MSSQWGFNIADVIALITSLIGIGIGFRQGLSAQMAILLMALSVWASLVNGLDPCRDWLALRFAIPAELARMGAVIILVVVPLLVVTLLYTLLRYVLKITFTTWIDRLGGAIAGGLTATGIVLLVFLFLNYLPPQHRPVAIGPQSWIGREVVGVETQLVNSIVARVGKGTNVISQARERHAGQREKWEE